MKNILIQLFVLFTLLFISANVNAEPTISGPSNVVVGQTYTYNINYPAPWTLQTGSWSVDGGVTISSNMSSITVRWTQAGGGSLFHSGNYSINGASLGAFPADMLVNISCPNISITPSTTIACVGQQVTLTAPTGFDSYTWGGAIGNGSTASFTPTVPNSSHTVSVTGTTGNCTTTSSVTIQVNPTKTVTNPVTIQANGSTTLCATGGTSYLWIPGRATSACINVSPNATTPYSVQITNACGTTTLNTQVIVEGTPLSISANDVCLGQNITASASGGKSPYSFSATAPIISQGFGAAIINPTSAGSVTIIVTDDENNSASKTVLVGQTPSFSLSVADPYLCAGESTTMSVVGGNADSYTWQIVSGVGSISGGGTNATIIPISNVSVRVTGTKNGCSFSVNRTIYMSSGQVSISASSNIVCSESTFMLYGNGANSYEWSVNGQVFSTVQNVQMSITMPTTVVLRGIDNCGNETYDQITLSVAPALNVDVTPETTHFLLGEDVTFTASSAEPLTYTWYDENRTQQLGIGAVFTQTPTENTTYTLVASNGVCEVSKQVHALLGMEREVVFCPPFKDQTFEPILTENYSVPNPDYDKNYIRSETMLTPVRTQTEIDALQINNDGKAVAFGFFDGLGRDQQTVQLEASPTGKNIIQHIEYDPFGRMSKGFLPHTGINSTNPFQQDAATQQADFYLNPIADYATTTIPYSEKIFENSPYSRVLEQAAQGEAYSLQSGHTIKAEERPNTIEDIVHQWYYDENSGRLMSDNFYQNGELWVNQTEDEHGTKTWQFTDKLGRLILQRTEMEKASKEDPKEDPKKKGSEENTGTPVETYYVYHKRFLKKPQFIIQPEGVKNYYGIEVVHLVPEEVTNWTFSYQYDGRGRVHKKWIPGQEGESTFIYDERDRMILAQTPNQKQQNEWTFTKYDALNRPVMSGLYNSDKTATELQSEIEAQELQDMYEYREVDVPFGYSNISFPIIEDTKKVLSVIYYDGYCDIFDEEANAESFLFAGNPLLLDDKQAATVRGLTTVSKTRVLEENGEWLASVIYYDDYHRSIQTQTQQMGGDWDIMTNLYDFSGKVLNTYQEHQSQIAPVVVQQSFKYDHAGRLLQTYHKINQEDEILLSNVRYNEVGQVKDKGLHGETPLQDITFQYNIRGWLTHINELANISSNEESKLFAFQIYYDEAGQFNGNIGAVQWRSTTDALQRGYDFSYDKLNRLIDATYSTEDETYNEDYSVSNITYDHNGNIQTLARNGLLDMRASRDPQSPIKEYGLIDDLNYSYVSAGRGASRIGSNRLMDVTDNAAQNSGIAGDFQDRMRGSYSDYEYDKNGNLLTDANKGIVKIIYNHLNLPERIVFATGNEIMNIYDAAGIKLKSQIVEQGVTLRTTHYKNGFIYEQKSTDFTPQLSFFGTAEGRIVNTQDMPEAPPVWTYEYHYKDHLGNLRVAFQAKEDTERERFALTMEDEKAAEEEKEFTNVAAARTSLKDKEGHYSAELTNADKAISKTIAVKKGDKIKASVFATHDPAIAMTDPTKAIQDAKKDVVKSLGGAAIGSIIIDNPNQGTNTGSSSEVNPSATQKIEPSRVRLNLLSFIPAIRSLKKLNKAKKDNILKPDMYFVPKGELVLQLRDSTDSLIFEKREKLTISSAVSWEKLVSDLEIKEDGNLSVYIDNPSSDKVFFDEFIIERTEATVAVVVQENHYYPFGMNMKGIEELDIQSLDGKDEHRFQYNGKEKEESFGLNWTDYGWRNMDVQLGRFTKIDRFSEKYYSLSSYNYVGNNPISRIDINGDSIYFNNTRGFAGELLTNLLYQLQEQTGLSLEINEKGMLNYLKDKDGNAIISSNENGDNIGSTSARGDLMNAIGNDQQTVEVAFHKGETGVPRDTNGQRENVILFNVEQALDFELGTDGSASSRRDPSFLSSKTMGAGMTFLHELLHTPLGGNLPDIPSPKTDFVSTGPTVDRVNIYRSEIDNNPATNVSQNGYYGNRNHYSTSVDDGVIKFSLPNGFIKEVTVN